MFQRFHYCAIKALSNLLYSICKYKTKFCNCNYEIFSPLNGDYLILPFALLLLNGAICPSLQSFGESWKYLLTFDAFLSSPIRTPCYPPEYWYAHQNTFWLVSEKGSHAIRIWNSNSSNIPVHSALLPLFTPYKGMLAHCKQGLEWLACCFKHICTIPYW